MKNIKTLFIAVLFLLASAQLFAQADSLPSQNQNDIYQIKLKDPVKCIQQLEYEKTSEPIKGYLDDDKTIIYLEDYKVNNRVKLRVIYENGNEEEILRSPCSIELKYTL